jgi:phosphohistidine phosphatase
MTNLILLACTGATARKAVSDRAKALTARGRRRTRRTARVLARLGVRRPRVLYSPSRRALETADILLKGLGGEGVACADLTKSPSPGLLAQIHGTCVVAVGHEPWLGELVARLVQGPRVKPRIGLAKMGLGWLEGQIRPGGMRLRALLPGKVLRKIARISRP